MKKKDYIKPQMEVFEIKTQQFLCSSINYVNDEYDDENDVLL